jgi:hypothetical protein
MGLNEQAAAVFGHLFASPPATQAAVVGTTSTVFFVLGGIAIASMLQALYERVFDVGAGRAAASPELISCCHGGGSWRGLRASPSCV